ncbi:MAG: substrate-binding domain-containing protein [Firmicutes bacterium]|nr:substrate-binding domain-containing protein [Bacillota bacterium]
MKLLCKMVFVFGVLFFVILTAVGCSGRNLSGVESRKMVKVIVKNKDADFWKVVKMGAEAAGKEFGVIVDFDGPTDEKDIQGQIELVRRVIDDKADALVLAACDYNRLVEVTEKVIDAKIPVIVIDSALNSRRIKSFIATDNVDAGRKAGEALIRLVGDDCKVAVMSFIKGAASADQREEGFFNIVDRHPGIKIVAKEYCFSDESLAESLTRKIIGENGDIDAFVCLNAYGVVGTARAIKHMNLAGKVKIIGFDSTPEEVSFIEKGVVQATVIQNPFSMGYLGVKNAVDAINGLSVPQYINTGSKVIDKNNMYFPENQKLVFPFVN